MPFTVDQHALHIFTNYIDILNENEFLYILGLLGLNDVPSNVYSAAVAILVLHVALGAFIYRAYFDDQSKAQTKRD